MVAEEIGIIGYGVYILRQRIKSELIVREREKKRRPLTVLGQARNGLMLRDKSVAGITEDSITIATEATLNAVEMAGIDPGKIETVAVGSESKP
jgi:hydroxymethylglutaryl-CoA synthase